MSDLNLTPEELEVWEEHDCSVKKLIQSILNLEDELAYAEDMGSITYDD